MTDEELAIFLGIRNVEGWERLIGKLTPDKRKLYEKLRDIENEIALFEAGVGPKPKGVILCGEKKHD